MGQFERRALEAEVVPRGVGQDKSKVNVNDVALRVHQNVAVVSVMDIRMQRQVGRRYEHLWNQTYLQYLPL